MEPIIVGIDPGITCAFAAISFDRKFLGVKSKRNYPMSELIMDIYGYGNPIVVGADKKETPKFIKDFSQKTGAKIHLTDYDTKKGEKKTLVRDAGFSDDVKNAHETDALASAIYAYKDLHSLIEKVDRFVKKEDIEDMRGKMLQEVLINESGIAAAWKNLQEKPKKVLEKKQIMTMIERKEPTKEEKEIMLLKKLSKKLKKENASLKKKVSELSNKKIDIDSLIKKNISFKEKKALSYQEENLKLKKKLKSSEKNIKKLNSFLDKIPNNVLVKKFDTLGSKERFKEHVKKGDVLYIKDISIKSKETAAFLEDLVSIIIYDKGNPKDDKRIYIRKDFPIEELGRFAIMRKDLLDSIVKKQAEKDRKDKGFILSILEEYKRQRSKDIE